MAQLSASERARLPDSAFAYIGSDGKRRLPIHDASHVRNALARFDRVSFESDEARQRARQRLLAAAKKHGIVPLGFIESQLRTDRKHAAAGRVVIEVAQIKSSDELQQQLRRALGDPTLAMLAWSDELDSWVDDAQQPVPLPATSDTRAVTVLQSRGAPSTALVHDPAVLHDADVAEAVLAAIEFVVERQRLERPARRPDTAHLPTGFVTHLLTDIEGSTELLTQLTDRYADVLAKVRRLIGQEVRRHGGHEVDVRADESFAVFEQADAAIRAAVALQRRIRSSRWPDRLQVRVRAGVHSGEIAWSDGGYVGLSLNTAARVMSAGHGGQILTTPATVATLGEDTASDVGFVSLGPHRLRGIPEPMEILQVEADGLLEEFPRLRAPAASTV